MNKPIKENEQNQREFQESILQINQSLKAFEEGRFFPAEVVIEELRKIIKRNQESFAKKTEKK